MDERLFLPRCWGEDPARRHKGKVPEEVEYRTSGHASAFRDSPAKRGERYIMEVPVNVVVRAAAGRTGRTPRWHAAKQYLRRRPVTAWQRFAVRDCQKASAAPSA